MGTVANGMNELPQRSKDMKCEEDGAFTENASICVNLELEFWNTLVSL